MVRGCGCSPNGVLKQLLLTDTHSLLPASNQTESRCFSTAANPYVNGNAVTYADVAFQKRRSTICWASLLLSSPHRPSASMLRGLQTVRRTRVLSRMQMLRSLKDVLPYLALPRSSWHYTCDVGPFNSGLERVQALVKRQAAGGHLAAGTWTVGPDQAQVCAHETGWEYDVPSP